MKTEVDELYYFPKVFTDHLIFDRLSKTNVHMERKSQQRSIFLLLTGEYLEK